MPVFDISPRPTKRRKTDSQENANLPLSSRAFRAVKQVVFGKSPSGSNSKSRDGSRSTDVATSVRTVMRTGRSSTDEVVDWDVPDSDDGGSEIPEKPAKPPSAVRSEQSIGMEPNSPDFTTNKRPRRSQLGHIGVNGSAGHESSVLVKHTKTVKRTLKTCPTSQDHDELAGDTTQGAVVDSANGIRTASTRKGRQQAEKVNDRRKTRNNVALGESKKENDVPLSRSNITGSLHGIHAEDANHPESERSNGDKPRPPSVKPDTFVNVPEIPTIRSGRKRGLQEFAGVDDTPINLTPSTPSGRKRGRPRKQTTKVTAIQNGQGDDLGFKEISPRRRSNDTSLMKADNVNETSPIDEAFPPVISRIAPESKGRRTTEGTGDGPSAAKSTSSKDIVERVLESATEDTIQGHAKELRFILKENTMGSLANLKTQLMDNITGKRRLPLVNLEEEHQKVRQLVEQTVLAGEGNSMLVIGSRGTAKTVLVESVVEELAVDHRDEFHVVRLNGFVHTDDKLALREIWRQLGREMEVDDDTGGRNNYADTLTSLLALLSHSAEASDAEQEHIAKSVIFVIDEFDLFASHPRQTLLYNLFDVAQSRNAPIAVLGLTTKIDVVESLEKRVKSRFGQRHVYLSLPKSYTAFQNICKSALSSQHSTISTRLTHEDASFQRLCTAWTNYVNALFTDDDIFDGLLFKMYTQTKSVSAFLAACLLPISFLSPSSVPTGMDFAAHTLSPPDSKLHLLPGLSDLELSLLIAAARLDIILDTDMCNFNMAYDEYQRLASRVKAQSSAAGQTAVGSGARVWGREIASGAWEHLANLELILPATGGGGKGEMGRANGRMWRVDVGLEEIGPSASGMNSVMAKWCKEI